MIEVFKTTVTDRQLAQRIVEAIHDEMINCRANFDLWDCDNILRVQSRTGELCPLAIIGVVERFGHSAEILPDDFSLLMNEKLAS
ncbi:MAG: hypothetical protein H7Y31_13390 [Chitinophagaceae bacterium]|nr:hypothetical protein [Chitinophagaceae bacterium]